MFFGIAKGRNNHVTMSSVYQVKAGIFVLATNALIFWTTLNANLTFAVKLMLPYIYERCD